MSLPDNSEWYTPERAIAEEVGWCLSGAWKAHAAFLVPRLEAHGLTTVIEWGCGTGHVAAALPTGTDYLGVDRNEFFLKRARERNKARPSLRFEQGDVRTYLEASGLPGDFGVSCAWFFLKHFGLEEWDLIVGKVLAAARFGAFNAQVLDKDLDTGTDYHHVYVTDRRLENAVLQAGHEIVERQVQEEAAVPGHGVMLDVAVWTRRVSA